MKTWFTSKGSQRCHFFEYLLGLDLNYVVIFLSVLHTLNETKQSMWPKVALARTKQGRSRHNAHWAGGPGLWYRSSHVACTQGMQCRALWDHDGLRFPSYQLPELGLVIWLCSAWYQLCWVTTMMESNLIHRGPVYDQPCMAVEDAAPWSFSFPRVYTCLHIVTDLCSLSFQDRENVPSLVSFSFSSPPFSLRWGN